MCLRVCRWRALPRELTSYNSAKGERFSYLTASMKVNLQAPFRAPRGPGAAGEKSLRGSTACLQTRSPEGGGIPGRTRGDRGRPKPPAQGSCCRAGLTDRDLSPWTQGVRPAISHPLAAHSQAPPRAAERGRPVDAVPGESSWEPGRLRPLTSHF